MMSESKVELTLSLIPILSVNELISDTDSVALDDWLENSDEGLINFEAARKNEKETRIEKEDLNSLLSQLSTSHNQLIYKSEKLVIKQIAEEFIMHDGDKPFILQQGDIIQLSGILLKVEIKREHLVKNVPKEERAIIASEIEDIWSCAHESADNNNRFADPFSQQFDSLKRETNVSLHDPLGFLYQDPKTELNQNIFPLDRESTALNINTRLSYRPSTSLYPEETFDHPKIRSQGREESSDGNVLNDLGINEEGSTIIRRNYNSGKYSYQEQAPMDILDEYLDESDSFGYIKNSNTSQQTQPHNLLDVRSSFYNQSSSNLPSERSSVSYVCKKFLKIFID